MCACACVCVCDSHKLLGRQQELGVFFPSRAAGLWGSDPYSLMSKPIFNFNSVMAFHFEFLPPKPRHQIPQDFVKCSTAMNKKGWVVIITWSSKIWLVTLVTFMKVNCPQPAFYKYKIYLHISQIKITDAFISRAEVQPVQVLPR